MGQRWGGAEMGWLSQCGADLTGFLDSLNSLYDTQ